MKFDQAIDLFLEDRRVQGRVMEFDRIELLSALGQAIAGDMGRLGWPHVVTHRNKLTLLDGAAA